MVVIRAVEFRGAAGGGEGEDATRGGSGSGGGLGFGAPPVGAFVIEGGKARWQPAVDVTRVLLQVVFAALGITFVLRLRRR